MDDCRGFDFADDDNDPSPLTLPELKDDGSDCLKWHATMIAGLAGARGDNGTGVAGVSWKVSLMNVKKHRDSTCQSTTTRSVESIMYAIDNGANVISMSFSSSSYSGNFEAALQEADRAGLLMVSSGGNGGANDDAEHRYPNQYAVDAAVVVANSTNQDTLHVSANWGASTVDMAAPGTDVVSTAIYGPNEYAIGTGASFSAGFAAGAAALVWSAFPALSNLEVTRALDEGVEPIASMDCAVTARCVRTGGRIDLYGALARASQLAPVELVAGATLIETSGDGRLDPGEEAGLTLSLMNMGRGAGYGLGVRIADAGGLEVVSGEAAIGTLPSGESLELTDALRVKAPADCTPFDAPLTLTFTDRFGTTFDAPVTARVECAEKTVDPGMDPMNGEDGGQLYDDPDPSSSRRSGCTATGGPAGGALFLVALGLLIAARRR